MCRLSLLRHTKRARVIHRGGKNSEGRIYLETLTFYSESQKEKVEVLKSDKFRIDDLIARHKARYGLVALFCRPDLKVLDFPCGSGYASRLLQEYDIFYEGRDNDPVTLEYAKHIYGSDKSQYITDDLSNSDLAGESYDIIACIEGIEHIGREYQQTAINAFKRALKPDGVFIISSPEAPNGISSISKTNKWHLWELSKAGFLDLLSPYFSSIELITQINQLHTGEIANCFYAICRK